MFRSIWTALSPSPLLAAALGGAWLLLMTAEPLAAAVPDRSEPLLLAVRINGSDQREAFRLLQLGDGGLAVADADLRAWRLSVPPGEFVAGGRSYHRLDAIPGLSYRVDAASQTLVLEAPAAAFTATTLGPGGTPAPALTPTRPGGFLNYDLQGQRSAGRGSGSGLFEAGFFNAHGNGTATALWNTASPERPWVRLDTTWTMDDPQTMRSLRLGDAVGRGGAWGRSVRFGGMQWASNFATRPDFIALPLPGFHGEAVLPSAVDVYVNNAHRLHSELPPGPFDIPEVPLVTGQGQVQLVVTDMLGRQQVLTRPYYASASLLRPGLHDFSVEAGSVREDYGIASARYGPGMLAATDRLGITPEFTRELRAEALRGQQTVGAGGVWLWPRFGTSNLAAAASHGPDGAGRLLQAGAERQARDVSLAVEATWASRDFVQLGMLAGSSLRRNVTASIGIPLANNALGVSYVRQSNWQGGENRLLSASYSLRLGSLGFLGFYALRNFSGEPATTVGVTLTHALDARTSASADAARAGGQSQSTLQLQRNLPAGDGFGYRVLAGQGQYDRYDASGTWRTSRGDLSAEAGRLAGADSYRVGFSGGIAVLGGTAFVGRRIDDSFAVVKVGDFAGVRVYQDHQEIGRTGPDGLIMATRLRPYQDNPIGVEQADLPIDAEIDSLQLELTPALRSGVYAEVPVRRVRSATFRLVDEQGKSLPPGSMVRLEESTKRFPVGYDGRAFVSGVGGRNRLEVEWDGGRCTVELPRDEGKAAMPDLGTLVCRGIGP